MWTIRAPSHSGDGRVLGASPLLLLLLAEVLAVIRIVFNEGEDRRRTGTARCPKVAGNVGGGSGLTWPLRARVRVSESTAVVARCRPDSVDRGWGRGRETQTNAISLWFESEHTFGNLQLLHTSVNFKLDTSQFVAICTLHRQSKCTLPCLSPSSSTTQYGTSLPVAPTWTVSISSLYGTGDRLAAEGENGHTSTVVSGGNE